ncbi:MAG: RNA 2',3'-cyclic phosphodiesterase [Candidatus Altiarchaeota archaeon]
MRCFLAIECPEEIKDRLAEVQYELSLCGGLKAVEYENLHLTLKFLGEVDETGLDRLKAVLDGVKASRYKIVVKGVGAFPNPGNPKVIWAGIGAGFDESISLHEKVDTALLPLGFQPEERFHPHITLARVKGPTDGNRMEALVESHSETAFGEYCVDGFALMQSRLTPNGPTYTEIGRFRLG